MAIFDRDMGICVDCNAEVSGGRAFGATACRCKNCSKQWSDRATAAIAATYLKSERRREVEAKQDRTY